MEASAVGENWWKRDSQREAYLVAVDTGFEGVASLLVYFFCESHLEICSLHLFPFVIVDASPSLVANWRAEVLAGVPDEGVYESPAQLQ